MKRIIDRLFQGQTLAATLLVSLGFLVITTLVSLQASFEHLV